MSWIFLKANNGQLDPGVGDKDFSVLNIMHCISKYTINGIFSMILNFNQPTILMKPKNLQLLYISILRNEKASGHSHILLTSVRACSSWLNSSWPGTHMLIRYGSMTPCGSHMRPLPSPLRAPLLLRKVVWNVHVALSNLTQHLFCIDIWWTRSPEHQCSMRRLTITSGSEKTVRVSRGMDCPFVVIKYHVSANNKNLYVA